MSDVAKYGNRQIPRITREERSSGQFVRVGDESQRYHAALREPDPHTLKDTHIWPSILRDICAHAPEKAERWSFGKPSNEKGYYFVQYFRPTTSSQ